MLLPASHPHCYSHAAPHRQREGGPCLPGGRDESRHTELGHAQRQGPTGWQKLGPPDQRGWAAAETPVPLLLCPALSWPLWRPQGWRGLACGWFSQLSTLCAPPWPAAPLLEALPCAPRAAVLAPGWAAWSASERAGPLSGATSQSLVGRQPPTPLTLMPSNRDRARRGRSARNVRSDLMGPISEKPRVWATRLTSETCGKQGRGRGASSGDRWKGSGVPESSTGCERAGSPCPPPIFIIPNCLAFPRTGPAFLGPQRWGKPKRVLAFRP